MAEHPIQGLMKTAMENIREMVDVNTIIGDAVETPDGHIIIPVSKVGFGFAAGGSEFTGGYSQDGESDQGSYGRGRDQGQDQGQGQGSKFPFGGGSGGGISITPVAFIVVGGEHGIKVLNMERQTHLYDKLIDLVPSLMERVQNFGKNKNSRDRNDSSGHLNDCI